MATAEPDLPPVRATRFALEGAELVVFVHGEDPGLEGLGLSPAQAEILGLVELGDRNSDIARRLGLSPAAVRKRLEATFKRLGVHSRSELAVLLQERRRSR